MNDTAFSTLPLPKALQETVLSLGYETMTPIQAQSLPYILAGKDVIAQGQTGSGKTAAFALGLLAKLDVGRFRIQSLVLCPTRELADQVAKDIRTLARAIHNIKVLTLCGGVPIGPQIGSLEHGAHIIVGTPGRIEDHVRRGTLKLKDVSLLVLDEADRMLEMGFQEAMDAIIDRCPDDRQTLLFSATFPQQIAAIASRIMKMPETIKVESTHNDTTIEQHFYRIENNTNRLKALRLLLSHFRPESTLIFCNTKRDTQDVADALKQTGFSVLAIHGDLEQRDRDQTLIRFANKSVSILVATDVAARGLDIDSLDAVINYQVAHDAEVHLHRVGRTGRAGSKGIACTLYDEKESYRVSQLDEQLDPIKNSEALPVVSDHSAAPMHPSFTTLKIDGGKKQKLRPGDIVGALTNGGKITAAQIGKIHLGENWAYVAISQQLAKTALTLITEGKLKGRNFRARLLID